MKAITWILVNFMMLLMISSSYAVEALWPEKTHYRHAEVEGNKIFYRESGHKIQNAPTLVLLHGWPASSHYFRELIPLLSSRFHIIAPDNLGSGYSDKPDPTKQAYTFELLAKHVYGLLNKLDIKEYVIYVQDFGAPVGFRTMMLEPKRVVGIIAQNGIAHHEGLGTGTEDFFKKQYANKKPDFYEKMGLMSEDVIKGVYLSNTNHRHSLQSPDAWTHDYHFLNTKELQFIQSQLLQDYVNNLKDYPKWQKTFTEHQPKTLAIWGEIDTFFISDGGKAFKKNIKDANYVGLDGGHFLLEEKPVAVAKQIIPFMQQFYK